MTREEALIRQDEAFRTLAPNANRIIQEAIIPIVELTYNLMKDNGLFPPVENPELEGVELEVIMLSPLSRTSKIEEANSFTRLLQTVVVPLAQMDPAVMDNLNLNESLRKSAADLGISTAIMNSPEKVEELRDRREELQRAQLEAQLAQQADQAAQNTPEEPDGTI
jgi:hypothetical protein